MFPNVRLMIAAMVASVVALSCGFAIFAAFRVNHEPLSRLATGAAPLQLTAGNPLPPAAMPAAAESFGVRFPSSQGEIPDATAEATPPEPAADAAPPSAVASTTRDAALAGAPERDGPAPAETETGAAEPPAPEQPAPVAQVPASETEAMQNDAAPSEVPAATSDTAAIEPPPEPAPAAEQAAPTEQASQETKPDIKKTAAAEPSPAESHPKPVHRHRVAAKPPRARQARAVQPRPQPTGVGGPFVPPTSR